MRGRRGRPKTIENPESLIGRGRRSPKYGKIGGYVEEGTFKTEGNDEERRKMKKTDIASLKATHPQS